MKKIVPLLLTLALCLWAADAWQSKPFTDWSDKDVQRLLNSSPWAKEVSIALGGGGGGGSSKGGGKRGGGGGGGGDIGGGDSPSGSSGGGSSRASVQEVGGGTLGSVPSLTLIVRWQTALPIREAIAKQKYGSEAGVSPDSKKLLEEQQKYYAIVVSGLPGRMLHASDDMKSNLLKVTTLSVKGKDPVVAADLQTAGNEQNAVVLFVFPKTSPFDAEDKEVEFSSKFGPIIVKQKFKLKEMVFNGKLEL
jgi:hypothetical protein